jgi:lipopolysaccharide/colanic/teichoic acid biosynthesis glycosyltransferase
MVALRDSADDGQTAWPRIAPKAPDVPAGDDVVIDLRDGAAVIDLTEPNLTEPDLTQPKPSYEDLDPELFLSLLDSCNEIDRRLRRTRVFDVVLGSSLLVVSVPIIAAAAVLIRISSKGSPFYASERYGYQDGRFGAWKLRTMVNEAEQQRILDENPDVAEQLERNCKLTDDPRITGIGRLLRRTSLDELPQLWNVVKGEMSLVGPRPKTMEEGPRYGPALETILSTRPGLTGLWQTSGRNDLPFEDRIVLDLEYLASRSMLGDIRLCLTTVRQFMSSAHHGAY